MSSHQLMLYLTLWTCGLGWEGRKDKALHIEYSELLICCVLAVLQTEWSCQEESDDQLRERPNSLSTHSPAGPQGPPLSFFLQFICVHL